MAYPQGQGRRGIETVQTFFRQGGKGKFLRTILWTASK